MLGTAIIVDDFYSNPKEVRQFALSQDFDVLGNFPGARTKPFIDDGIKDTFSKIIAPFGGKITDFQDQFTGSFQYATANDRSWIHSDKFCDWAAVVYLTPNAPLSSGTALFKHKKSGSLSTPYGLDPHAADGIDKTKWDMVDSFGNLFNRLVLYRARNYHISLDYFGTCKENCRLFQVFFFNTEF